MMMYPCWLIFIPKIHSGMLDNKQAAGDGKLRQVYWINITKYFKVQQKTKKDEMKWINMKQQKRVSTYRNVAQCRIVHLCIIHVVFCMMQLKFEWRGACACVHNRNNCNSSAFFSFFSVSFFFFAKDQLLMIMRIARAIKCFLYSWCITTFLVFVTFSFALRCS